MPAVPIISAIGATAGAVSAVKGASDAKKAAQTQANAPAPTVDIAALQRQAQATAAQNAALSAALEQRYNPGAQELRAGSLEALLGGLARSEESQALADMILSQAGRGLNAPGAQQYDSALTRAAVEQAAADLALGGELPQDVRNLVARRSLANAGTVARGGGLQLGRDLVARDLGLTSLDLRNRRLQNAATIGAQEAALAQGNAALRQRAGELGMEAERFGRTNLFDSASFLQNMSTGDFARALSAAQLGQNIAAPQAGLDPGSIANLAVGNTNAIAAKQQADTAAAIQAANQRSAAGSQLLGAGLGFFSNMQKTPTTPVYSYGTYQAPQTSYVSGLIPGF